MCRHTGYKTLYCNDVRKWKKFRQILLPLLLTGALLPSAAGGQQTGICDRTQQVQDAIVAAVSDKTTCGAITTTDLAGVASLSVTDDSSLTALKTGDFDGLTGLTTLTLTNNGLTGLPADVFDELSSLTELNLSGNDLSSLPAGVFDKLTSLTKLQMNVNDLSSLPAGVFDELTSLTLLGLNSNLLSSLLADVFDKLTSLQVLALAHNKLTSLPAGVFDKLTGLTTLRLDNNQVLTTLPAGVFDKLTSLTTLQLNHNALTSLPADVFDELTNLTTLFFSNRGPNALSSLPTGVFDKLTSLKTLSLLGNRLSTLSAGVFDELTSLEVLVLQNNGLSTLPPRVFDKLTSLKGLLLRGNPNLDCLPFIPLSLGAKLYHLDKPASTYAACGAAVTVTPTSLAVDENATSTYTVVLDEAPNRFTNNVTVTPASSDTTKATVSGPLTFSIWDDWSTPKTVTVTGVATGPATISHTVSGGGYGSATASNVAVAVGRVLISSSITHNSATLTLGGHTGDWYYKADAAPHASCSTDPVSTASVVLSNLAGNTSYTYKAYSDSGCNTELATASAFLTKPAKPSKPTATAGAGSGKLALTASVTGSGMLSKWQYQQKSTDTFGSWQNISGTSTSLSHVVSGLTDGTSYQFKVRAVNATGTGPASDASTAVAPGVGTLTASDITATTATLTLSNWSEAWSYKDGQKGHYISCTNVAAGTSEVSLSGLTPGRDYLVDAYNAHNCPITGNPYPRLDSVTFTALLHKVEGVSVTAGDASLTVDWTARSNVTGYHVQWKSGTEDWSSDRQSDATTTSATISNLTGGAPYTVRVRSYHSNYLGRIKYGQWSDTATGTPLETGRSTVPGTPSASLELTPSFGAATIQPQGYVQHSPIEPMILPMASGGDGNLTYTITPALPAGLTFDAATFTLSGTPTEASAKTTYAYTVTDADGDDATLTFSLTVAADLEPSFGATTIKGQICTQHSPIESMTLPMASGGNGDLTYTITPALPVGLTFDAATFSLSGTSPEAKAMTIYTYTVTDADGDPDFLTFFLMVMVDSVPSYGAATIEPQSYVQHSPIEPMTLPMASGGNGALTYTLTPALPAGLTFDAATRTLSGTPTEGSAVTTYTYTVTDGDGDKATLTFSLTVVDPVSFDEQQVANLRLPRGLVMEPLVLPEARGGNGPLTYALNPAPPVGLTFDPATRMFSGVPTRVQGPQSYEYTATDAGVGEPDVARLTFTIKVVVSAAERAILEIGLAAQSRALLSGATSVIGERFRSPGATSVPGVVAACTGTNPAEPGAESPPENCATGVLTAVTESLLGLRGGSAGLTDEDVTRPRGPRAAEFDAQPAWNWESLVWGRSFAVPLTNAGTGGSAWTLWGAGDIQGFRGDPRQGNYDGQVRSLYLGVDMQWQEQWLAGAALAQSWGETDYMAEPGGRTGQLETTLTSIYPYVRGTLGAGLEVWAIGGYGRGEAEHTQPGVGETSDLTMAMGATGARQPMTDWGGLQLALVGGAGYLSLATEEGTAGVADLDVAVQRARLAVEATWTTEGLTPYVQVGGRYDGGAGQTGSGLETVAGLRYTSERLEFEARGRWLAAHAAAGYEEYGGLARLAVRPLADGTGFRLNVAPRWGAADGAGLLGGGTALLDGGAMPGLGVSGIQASTNQVLAVQSEVGYGFAVFEGQGVLTPYGGLAFTGASPRRYRLGGRLGVAEWLTVSLEGTRQEASGQQPTDQGMQLRLEMRF